MGYESSSGKLSALVIDADLAMGAHNITLGAAQTVDGEDISVDLLKDTGGVVENKHFNKVVSDVLKHSIDAEVSEAVGGSNWLKKKTLTFTNGYKGAMRIKMDLRSSYADDYCDAILTEDGATPGTGADIGVEQHGTTTGYITHSQDVTLDLAAGETIDLWLQISYSVAYNINLRFYYTIATGVVAVTGAD